MSRTHMFRRLLFAENCTVENLNIGRVICISCHTTNGQIPYWKMAFYIAKNIRDFLKHAIHLSATCSHLARSMCSIPTDYSNSPNLEFSPECDEATREMLIKDFQIHEDFINVEEENNLVEELELKFKRSRYQYDHWDDVSWKKKMSCRLSNCKMTIICLTQKAIHGYRETEKPTWNKGNDCVVNRLRNFAFSTTTMQHVHVLDLAENGHIKPHLDSIKVKYKRW